MTGAIVEERSWYRDGFVIVRDPTVPHWHLLPYRRFIVPWYGRRIATPWYPRRKEAA